MLLLAAIGPQLRSSRKLQTLSNELHRYQDVFLPIDLNDEYISQPVNKRNIERVRLS